MISLRNETIFLLDGKEILSEDEYNARAKQDKTLPTKEQAKRNTISSKIIANHNSGDNVHLKLKFDALASHDMTNVNIIQTVRACGLKSFPIPVVLTNCQNTLCAVGGTINRDDHVFALSAAQKYGGICVPINIAVIHTYMREMLAGCGRMIMGADSHTRYGALGTMGIGEGGGELVKQIMGTTYDLQRPLTVAVYLTGTPRPGVGPHDISLALIGAVYKNNFVKNCILEFVGEGVHNLSMDFRNGIDVMTTETACWSSIWQTDEYTHEYLSIRNRDVEYKTLTPDSVACYDRLVYIDLSEVKPMIALPFHPSNTYSIDDFLVNAPDILHKVEMDAIKLTGNKNLVLNLHKKFYEGKFHVDQGNIGGCSGGMYENICAAADILSGKNIGNGIFNLTVYPDSQPTNLELIKNGKITDLIQSGVICREAICGPCTGVGEVPGNGEFSIRHNTRNFIYREGARPLDGQHAWVALMDSRSIAATAANKGVLTSAEYIDVKYTIPTYHFDINIYENRVYNGFGYPKTNTVLIEGLNIKPWPKIPHLPESLLVKICSYIDDPVTTTDELIPSGDTSSYRSNPIQMSNFTLYRKDPNYVPKAREIADIEKTREKLGDTVWSSDVLKPLYQKIVNILHDYNKSIKDIGIGSAIYAQKPGDGSAREQAASCQRILGGAINLASEYATLRYRANLINWGIIPFTTNDTDKFSNGDFILFPDIKSQLQSGQETITAYVLTKNIQIYVHTGELSKNERDILIAGSMINFMQQHQGKN